MPSSSTGRARQRWRRSIQWAVAAVRAAALLRPQVPVDRLHQLKPSFAMSTVGSGPPALVIDRGTFVASVHRVCDDRHFTSRQLRAWFDNTDVFGRGVLSWEQVSNAVIHEAAGVSNVDLRAIELTSNELQERRGFEHKGRVSTCAISPVDGSVFTAGEDGVVALWDPLAEHCRRWVQNARFFSNESSAANVPAAHAPITIVSVCVCPRGNLFVAAANKTVNVYSHDGLDIRTRYVARDSYNEMIRTPAGRLFNRANAVVNTVVLMGVDDSPSAIHVAQRSRVDHLYIGLMSGELLAFALKNPNALELRPVLRLRPHTQAITQLGVLPKLDLLTTCSWDSTVLLLRHATGSVAHRISVADDPTTGEPLGHRRGVSGFAFLARSRLLVTVSREREALVWNPAVDNPQARLQHPCMTVAVTCNDDDNHIITLAEDGALRVWSGYTFTLIQELAREPDSVVGIGALRHVAFSPKHSSVVACCMRPHSWSMRRRGVAFARQGGHVEPALHCAAGDKWAATADTATVIVWELSCGRRRCVWTPFATATAPGQAINGIGVDCSGRVLAVYGADGGLHIYCLANGLLLNVAQVAGPAPSHCTLELVSLVERGLMTYVLVISSPDGGLRSVRLDADWAVSAQRSLCAAGVRGIGSWCVVPPPPGSSGGAHIGASADDGQLSVAALRNGVTVNTVPADPAVGMVFLRGPDVLAQVTAAAVDLVAVWPTPRRVSRTALPAGLVPQSVAPLTEEAFIVADSNGWLFEVTVAPAAEQGAREGKPTCHFRRRLRIAESAVTSVSHCGALDVVVGCSLAGPISVSHLGQSRVLGHFGQSNAWSLMAHAGADASAMDLENSADDNIDAVMEASTTADHSLLQSFLAGAGSRSPSAARPFEAGHPQSTGGVAEEGGGNQSFASMGRIDGIAPVSPPPLLSPALQPSHMPEQRHPSPPRDPVTGPGDHSPLGRTPSPLRGKSRNKKPSMLLPELLDSGLKLPSLTTVPCGASPNAAMSLRSRSCTPGLGAKRGRRLLRTSTDGAISRPLAGSLDRDKTSGPEERVDGASLSPEQQPAGSTAPTPMLGPPASALGGTAATPQRRLLSRVSRRNNALSLSEGDGAFSQSAARCATPAGQLRNMFHGFHQECEDTSPLAQLRARQVERRLRPPQGEWVERVSSLMPLRAVVPVPGGSPTQHAQK